MLQSGGFLIPQNKIDQLIAYKHLLTDKQKRDILNSVQSGGQLVLNPQKANMEGFWVHYLLVSEFHLLLKRLKKITGGAPRMGSDLTKGSWCAENWNVSTTSIYRHMGTSSKRWR